MRFGVLGAFEVIDGAGESVDVGGSMPRTMLAALVIADGCTVPQDTIIDVLWGTRAPRTARSTVQSYVSRLRRILGSAADLRWDGVGYRLGVADEQVDARRFEREAMQGRLLLAAGNAAAAVETLIAADDLWRGDALAGFAEHDFARGTAVRLEERRLGAIEDRLRGELLLGRLGDVIERSTALAVEHPFREELHLLQARALYRGGRQVDAIRALQQLSERLRDELGVEPSRAVRDLESAILAQDPSLDGPSRSGPVSTPSRPAAFAPSSAPGTVRRRSHRCRPRRQAGW